MSETTPAASDIDAWFAELDRFADVPFLDDGRRQPSVPGVEDMGRRDGAASHHQGDSLPDAGGSRGCPWVEVEP
ncbi:MAG TPA: hypothetical protein VGS19_22225 [Streptosporangiaceae bacterium]|nr:hypothetical protein [Streptosporangiaceae bacterium]